MLIFKIYYIGLLTVNNIRNIYVSYHALKTWNVTLHINVVEQKKHKIRLEVITVGLFLFLFLNSTIPTNTRVKINKNSLHAPGIKFVS